MRHRTLIELIRRHYALDWCGVHGAAHWARVRDNGLRLATTTGANRSVVELFALLHDSMRINDDADPMHGKRAADFAQSLYGTVITLEPDAFDLLLRACEGHTHRNSDENVTIATCWDADRLDLGRVGITPDPERLCTEAAKAPAMIQWAYARSLAWMSHR